MDKDAVREHLARLKTEIEEARRRNPGSSSSADAGLGEIQRLIDASNDAPHPTIPERLEGVAVQFEAEHPTLAASARRLIDLLAEVGI